MEKLVAQRRQERQELELENSRMERQMKYMNDMINENEEVAMEDEKQRKAKMPFSGQGMRLGDPGPPASHSLSTVEAGPCVNVDPIIVSDSEPTTNVQIRLEGGGREVVKLNLSHKVSHLIQEVTSRKSEGRPFKLVDMGPPPRVLDTDISIKEAGLAGGSVMQRFT